MKQFFSYNYDATMPIIFFDRDGTITKNSDFLLSPNNIVFYQNTIKAIHLLNAYRFPIVIITNQPAVARGWITEKQLIELNAKIVTTLNKVGAYITAIYSCPHHPQATLPKYRIVCSCRKPNTFFVHDAIKRLHVSSHEGYMIGDKTSDIQTGKNAHLVNFLIKTGYAGTDGLYSTKSDYTCNTSLQAAKIILSRHIAQEHQ